MADRFKVEIVATDPGNRDYAIVFEHGKVVLDKLYFSDLRDLCQHLIAASFHIGTAEDLLKHGV